MLITQLQVKDWRAIKDLTLQLDPQLTVIHGPNESGKSSIREALRAAFLVSSRPRGKTILAQARPWGKSSIKPQVTVDFEHEGDSYQLKRVFYADGSELWKNDKLVAKEAEVLSALEELLPKGFETLWSIQGELNVVQVTPELRGQLAASEAVAPGSDWLERRLNKDFDTYWTQQREDPRRILQDPREELARNQAEERSLQMQMQTLETEALGYQQREQALRAEQRGLEQLREQEQELRKQVEEEERSQQAQIQQLQQQLKTQQTWKERFREASEKLEQAWQQLQSHGVQRLELERQLEAAPGRAQLEECQLLADYLQAFLGQRLDQELAQLPSCTDAEVHSMQTLEVDLVRLEELLVQAQELHQSQQQLSALQQNLQEQELEQQSLRQQVLEEAAAREASKEQTRHQAGEVGSQHQQLEQLWGRWRRQWDEFQGLLPSYHEHQEMLAGLEHRLEAQPDRSGVQHLRHLQKRLQGARFRHLRDNLHRLQVPSADQLESIQHRARRLEEWQKLQPLIMEVHQQEHLSEQAQQSYVEAESLLSQARDRHQEHDQRENRRRQLQQQGEEYQAWRARYATAQEKFATVWQEAQTYQLRKQEMEDLLQQAPDGRLLEEAACTRDYLQGALGQRWDQALGSRPDCTPEDLASMRRLEQESAILEQLRQLALEMEQDDGQLGQLQQELQALADSQRQLQEQQQIEARASHELQQKTQSEISDIQAENSRLQALTQRWEKLVADFSRLLPTWQQQQAQLEAINLAMQDTQGPALAELRQRMTRLRARRHRDLQAQLLKIQAPDDTQVEMLRVAAHKNESWQHLVPMARELESLQQQCQQIQQHLSQSQETLNLAQQEQRDASQQWGERLGHAQQHHGERRAELERLQGLQQRWVEQWQRSQDSLASLENYRTQVAQFEKESGPQPDRGGSLRTQAQIDWITLHLIQALEKVVGESPPPQTVELISTPSSGSYARLVALSITLAVVGLALALAGHWEPIPMLAATGGLGLAGAGLGFALGLHKISGVGSEMVSQVEAQQLAVKLSETQLRNKEHKLQLEALRRPGRSLQDLKAAYPDLVTHPGDPSQLQSLLEQARTAHSQAEADFQAAQQKEADCQQSRQQLLQRNPEPLLHREEELLNQLAAQIGQPTTLCADHLGHNIQHLQSECDRLELELEGFKKDRPQEDPSGPQRVQVEQEKNQLLRAEGSAQAIQKTLRERWSHVGFAGSGEDLSVWLEEFFLQAERLGGQFQSELGALGLSSLDEAQQRQAQARPVLAALAEFKEVPAEEATCDLLIDEEDLAAEMSALGQQITAAETLREMDHKRHQQLQEEQSRLLKSGVDSQVRASWESLSQLAQELDFPWPANFPDLPELDGLRDLERSRCAQRQEKLEQCRLVFDGALHNSESVPPDDALRSLGERIATLKGARQLRLERFQKSSKSSALNLEPGLASVESACQTRHTQLQALYERFAVEHSDEAERVQEGRSALRAARMKLPEVPQARWQELARLVPRAEYLSQLPAAQIAEELQSVELQVERLQGELELARQQWNQRKLELAEFSAHDPQVRLEGLYDNLRQLCGQQAGFPALGNQPQLPPDCLPGLDEENARLMLQMQQLPADDPIEAGALEASQSRLDEAKNHHQRVQGALQSLQSSLQDKFQQLAVTDTGSFELELARLQQEQEQQLQSLGIDSLEDGLQRQAEALPLSLALADYQDPPTVESEEDLPDSLAEVENRLSQLPKEIEEAEMALEVAQRDRSKVQQEHSALLQDGVASRVQSKWTELRQTSQELSLAWPDEFPELADDKESARLIKQRLGELAARRDQLQQQMQSPASPQEQELQQGLGLCEEAVGQLRNQVAAFKGTTQTLTEGFHKKASQRVGSTPTGAGELDELILDERSQLDHLYESLGVTDSTQARNAQELRKGLQTRRRSLPNQEDPSRGLELRARLARAGDIDELDLDQLSEELKAAQADLVRQQQQYEQAAEEFAGLRDRLAQHLAGDPTPLLKGRYESLVQLAGEQDCLPALPEEPTLPAQDFLDPLDRFGLTLQAQLERAKNETPEELSQLREEFATLKSQLAGMDQRVQAESKELQQYLGKQKASQDLYSQYVAKKESVAKQSHKLRALELEANAIKLLRQCLIEARKELEEDLIGPLRDAVAAKISVMTQGRYEGLEMGQDSRINNLLTAQQTQAPVADLSFGTQEQIAFLSRLCLGELISNGERHLVVFDDNLVHSDRSRIERACQMLLEASQTSQILVLTCHPESFQPLITTGKEIALPAPV